MGYKSLEITSIGRAFNVIYRDVNGEKSDKFLYDSRMVKGLQPGCSITVKKSDKKIRIEPAEGGFSFDGMKSMEGIYGVLDNLFRYFEEEIENE